MPRSPTLVMLGPVGTRWLFAVVVVSALCAWASETALGVIDPNDRIAYPCIATAFSVLALLVWRRPVRLSHWQRWRVTLLATYFSLAMLAFTLRPDPGPSLYTLGSFAPWLGQADSHALTMWGRHESAFIDMLPARRAKALSGAMQRLDFDAAQAALRGQTLDKP